VLPKHLLTLLLLLLLPATLLPHLLLLVVVSTTLLLLDSPQTFWHPRNMPILLLLQEVLLLQLPLQRFRSSSRNLSLPCPHHPLHQPMLVVHPRCRRSTRHKTPLQKLLPHKPSLITPNCCCYSTPFCQCNCCVATPGREDPPS
jgi:hypothetical protein